MAEHGTRAALIRHRRAREAPCDECQEHSRLYARDRRVRLGTGRALTFPLELGVDDFDGVGATIARGVRESA